MTLCPYCNSDNPKIITTVVDIFKDTYHLTECLSCNILFISPQPTDEQLEKAYSEDYYGAGSEEKFNDSIIVKAINFFSKQRARRLLSHIKKSDATILDWGCGNGRFLENINKLNTKTDLIGIEINKKTVERSSARLGNKAKIYHTNNPANLLPHSTCDAIACIHVFEHIPNPKNTIACFSSLLREGGVLMLVIPNISSWQAKIFDKNWFHLDIPRHIHFFPPKILIRELEKNGFKLISTRTFDTEQNPYGALQSTLNKILKKRNVLYEALKGNKTYADNYFPFAVFLMKLFWLASLPFFIITDAFASLFKKGATVELIFKKSLINS